MASSPNKFPLENVGAERSAADDQTATLTPPPSSSGTGAANVFDSPTIVDAGSGVTSPVLAHDAPTILDVGAPGKPPPQPLYSGLLMLPPGTVLGQRYEIVAMLGEGGMGAVYKATDRELDRPVALKVIRPELARNKAMIDRFKQELLLAHQVTHKNVIRIYDLGEADGVKFITMEFIEGQDLRSLLLQKKKMSPEEAVDIIQQVCRALEAAHSVGIIHRDLKPQNIMRDKTGRILVMDFGLARTLEGDGMTNTGALVGTMDYMSPEQALAQTLDQRSDLYTVGLIFYELLTGNMPFQADSALASLIKRTQERVAPVSDHDSAIPRSVSNIVSKCLERDLNLRYRSAAELLEDLEAWQGKRAAATLSFHAKVGPWGQGLPWPLITAVVTVLALSVTGWMFRGRLFGPSSHRGVASGPQISLAILPFRNVSGDPSLDWLGASLAEMLTTNVGQSASLRTVPEDRVHQVFSDLRLAPNASVDPETLRRVGEFSSADTLVWGQYAKFGTRIRIDANVQDLKHDRVVPVKIEGVDEKDIPSAVDRLASSIRDNLSFSPDVIKELQASSFQPSSKSASALRSYNEGVQFLREGRNLDAVRVLKSATTDDAQFALAYSRLAEADSALGYDNDAEDASRKAVDLSQPLPMAEKYLIQAAHSRVMKDNKKAIEAYESLARSMPRNPDVESALGSLYTDTGAYDKARAQLSRLLESDPKNMKALWQSGVVEMMNDNDQAALDPLNKALSLAVETDNSEMKALILQAMGISYRVMNKPDEAIRDYQEAMEINRRLGLKRNLAGNLVEMAVIENNRGKVDAALSDYQEALRLQREIGMKKEVGDTLIDMGVVYETKGDYDKALQNYKESLQIQRDAGDENYQALCLSNIGGVYLAKADSDNALTYLQQALQLRQKLNVPGDIADTLASIGVVYTTTGQYDEAMTSFMRALDLARRAGNARGAADDSHQMGLVFEYQGRPGPAVAAIQDAVNGYRAIGNRASEMVDSLTDLSSALAQAGRGADSASLLNEADSLAKDLKNKRIDSELLTSRGDVAFYQGDFAAARKYYDQALSAATAAGDHDQMLSSRLRVVETALGQGRSPSALRDLRDLTQQADSRGLKYLALQGSVDQAEAMIDGKDYSHAQQELHADLSKSEKLGSRYETARIHSLLGSALRLAGNSADAATEYRQAAALIDEMRKEPGADKLLDRADVGKIYSDANQWSAAAAH
jgi:eukaryotic-like serine/threonine-protein kinase